ncbi:PD-(D/E)XK motif protein [Cytophagaceae bacterium YF14B1]|uniref:PD-(D/E)XK motif protein n=1 Tax=Xanthocytophaga flava TaxID=3048013 RepID=A0AAE3UAQ5_9BACT|nr:PD-(D/E)XK motif protein [Xanthocytophaga flavus]MDJ1483588.1 PD-(D/E)XK motif protein [Xanthocytophaga flavus]
MKLYWNILLADDSQLPRTLFFEDLPDDRFRYGLNEKKQYCLFFHFPSDKHNHLIATLAMANIILEEKRMEGKDTLVLTLLNEDFKDLFTDLILSIVREVKDTESEITKSGFILLCRKWFEFFDPLKGQLTESDLQAIYAELSFLRYLLSESDCSYNDILLSWKGPFGNKHDFELDTVHFEIKSIQDYKDIVQISSEHQLDFMADQSLYLVVCRFSDDHKEKRTVSNLSQEIVDQLRSVTGTDLSLYWTALRKSGLNFSNIHQYDHYLFKLSEVEYYNCSSEDFPSLRRSFLPDSLRNIKYDLALSGISHYRTEDISLLI